MQKKLSYQLTRVQKPLHHKDNLSNWFDIGTINQHFDLRRDAVKRGLVPPSFAEEDACDETSAVYLVYAFENLSVPQVSEAVATARVCNPTIAPVCSAFKNEVEISRFCSATHHVAPHRLLLHSILANYKRAVVMVDDYILRYMTGHLDIGSAEIGEPTMWHESMRTPYLIWKLDEPDST